MELGSQEFLKPWIRNMHNRKRLILSLLALVSFSIWKHHRHDSRQSLNAYGYLFTF